MEKMEKSLLQNSFEQNANKFNSPQEELNFLREQLKQKEREINLPETTKEEGARQEIIRQYAKINPQDVLTDSHQIKESEAEAITLDLEPKDSDKKIEELLGLTEEKGIKNTLTIVQKTENPSLEDDFHRVLVQYIKKGYPLKNLKEKSSLAKTLKMTLYEVVLPNEESGTEKTLKELISSMEQFYAGMLSVSDSPKSASNCFGLEITVPNNDDEIIFYIAVPDNKKDLFEKQLLSVFPTARIKEEKNDYNIFKGGYNFAGARMRLDKKAIYPIKTYIDFDYDPLNVILNSLSKLTREEGASIQILFSTGKNSYTEKYKNALAQIQKGIPKSEALNIPESGAGEFAKTLKEIFTTSKKTDAPIDETLVENIKNKISSPIVQTNVRLVSSAQSQSRADDILSEMEASFNQFEDPNGNKITFKKIKKNALKQLLYKFSFREFNRKYVLPFNLKEITTLFHLPNTNIKSAHQLKQVSAKSAPAPISLSKEGTLLGINTFHNVKTKIFISPEDRFRHFYIVGQTGTGKTVLLKNMLAQDIQKGSGVCLIDPHGSDIQDILSIIPPERYEDVIYFDPANLERPMGLNMLEYDANYPEQKTFVVNEMFSIFDKLFDLKATGGPMFEQYFRNAVQLVIDDPLDKSTLLDVSKVLANADFRKEKLAKCKNPIVVQFWKEIAEKSGGDTALANIVPYITSKFDIFTGDDFMRPIIAQRESAFDFKKIMDEKKILLVNLSKGRLGEINSHLLGLIIVGKILMATLSRETSADTPPFYLYIDEFQNVTTNSISVILSEARKYKLSLNIAHQFIAQLDEKIKDAVFGNVGSMAIFRTGADDAEYLSKQFEPTFNAKDITNLDNWNAYLKILDHGQPQKPFNIQTIASPRGNPEAAEKLKELSQLKYGQDRSLVDKEIALKYSS